MARELSISHRDRIRGCFDCIAVEVRQSSNFSMCEVQTKNARERTRTATALRPRDFKSLVSTISPPKQRKRVSKLFQQMSIKSSNPSYILRAVIFIDLSFYPSIEEGEV